MSAGAPATGSSYYPHLARAGRYVAFYADAGNLPGGSASDDQLYLRDTAKGKTKLVSRKPNGIRRRLPRVPVALARRPLGELLLRQRERARRRPVHQRLRRPAAPLSRQVPATARGPSRSSGLSEGARPGGWPSTPRGAAERRAPPFKRPRLRGRLTSRTTRARRLPGPASQVASK